MYPPGESQASCASGGAPAQEAQGKGFRLVCASPTLRRRVRSVPLGETKRWCRGENCGGRKNVKAASPRARRRRAAARHCAGRVHRCRHGAQLSVSNLGARPRDRRMGGCGHRHRAQRGGASAIRITLRRSVRGKGCDRYRRTATQMGSRLYAGHQPIYDAGVVGNLRGAGAILLGKTVTCEFAGIEPSNTANPSDPARTPWRVFQRIRRRRRGLYGSIRPGNADGGFRASASGVLRGCGLQADLWLLFDRRDEACRAFIRYGGPDRPFGGRRSYRPFGADERADTRPLDGCAADWSLPIPSRQHGGRGGGESLRV